MLLLLSYDGSPRRILDRGDDGRIACEKRLSKVPLMNPVRKGLLINNTTVAIIKERRSRRSMKIFKIILICILCIGIMTGIVYLVKWLL